MPLPKINHPVYTCTMPSTGKSVQFRPFTVKEEKIFLLAKEEKDVGAINAALNNVVQNCTFGKVDINNVPSYDFEYLFLQLRCKSVGEMVELKYRCKGLNPDKTACGNIVKISLGLDNVEVVRKDAHKKTIPLGDNLGLVMRHPSVAVLNRILGKTPSKKMTPDQLFDLLRECIESVYDGDQLYASADSTKEEMNDFLDALNQGQFQKLKDWFDSMPALEKKIDITCSKCGSVDTAVLRGLQDFFI